MLLASPGPGGCRWCCQTTHVLSSSPWPILGEALDPKCCHQEGLMAPAENVITWGILDQANIPHKVGQGLAGSAQISQTQNKTKPERGPF